MGGLVDPSFVSKCTHRFLNPPHAAHLCYGHRATSLPGLQKKTVSLSLRKQGMWKNSLHKGPFLVGQ